MARVSKRKQHLRRAAKFARELRMKSITSVPAVGFEESTLNLEDKTESGKQISKRTKSNLTNLEKAREASLRKRKLMTAQTLSADDGSTAETTSNNKEASYAQRSFFEKGGHESSGPTDDGLEIGVAIKTEVPDDDVEGDACSDCDNDCCSTSNQEQAQESITERKTNGPSYQSTDLSPRQGPQRTARRYEANWSDSRHNGPWTQHDATLRGPCTESALRNKLLQEEHDLRLKHLTEEHKVRMQNLDLEHEVLCFTRTNILIKRKFLLSRMNQKLTRSAAAQLEMTMSVGIPVVENLNGTDNIKPRKMQKKKSGQVLECEV